MIKTHPYRRRLSHLPEGDDALGRARQAADDEADTRVQLARMPFDLGHDMCPVAGSPAYPGAALGRVGGPLDRVLVSAGRERALGPLRARRALRAAIGDAWFCILRSPMTTGRWTDRSRARLTTRTGQPAPPPPAPVAYARHALTVWQGLRGQPSPLARVRALRPAKIR